MKKGFILLNTLILFVNISLMITCCTKILSYKMEMLERIEKNNRIYQIESTVIKRVRDDFMFFTTENFHQVINFSFVYVVYVEDQDLAYITSIGLYNFSAVLEYNQEYATVADYYYR